jgi:hypothetical protein
MNKTPEGGQAQSGVEGEQQEQALSLSGFSLIGSKRSSPSPFYEELRAATPCVLLARAMAHRITSPCKPLPAELQRSIGAAWATHRKAR